MMATMVCKEVQEVVMAIVCFLILLVTNLLLAAMAEQVAPVLLVVLEAQPTAAHHHPTLAQLGLEETVVVVVQAVREADFRVEIVQLMGLLGVEPHL